uniref:60S RIBOSOMAL PROTEIN L9 n=1 Tax=Anncaliia algerae TaxID=723287 RepID=E3PYB4_9MICR|nr:60S RIBOSOMAL PROTEIN L9 [Anncaliia algerae]
MKRLLVEELVTIPEGCIVDISKKVITITGSKATIVKDMSHFILYFDLHENSIRIRLWNGVSRERNKLITAASILKNAINGCMIGYSYTLKVVNKHFPMNLEIAKGGKEVVVKNFLGQKAVRRFKMHGQSVASLGEDKDYLIIQGPSIEEVSQSAGSIQENCQVKKFDSRTFLDGIYFVKKGLIETDL